MSTTRRRIPMWRHLVELLVFIAASTLAMFILSSIALVIYTQGVDGPTEVAVVIAEGSAAAVEGGDSLADVPPVWTFNDGDTLILINEDTVTHQLGETSLAPGETATVVIDPEVGGELETTLHPTGFITLSVEPAGFEFSTIAFTTFAFGIAVGVILYAGMTIFRAMGRHDDEDWQDEPGDDAPGDKAGI